MSSVERIVVLEPNVLAAATVVERIRSAGGKTRTSFVAGHDALVFIARGEGFYRTSGHAGVLRPNTLIAAPAGEFTCVLSDNREAYVLTVADTAITPRDQRAFLPFFERKLAGADARFWHDLMRDSAHRIAADGFCAADLAHLKSMAAPLLWQRQSKHDTVSAFLESLWPRLAEPLMLDRLARDVGYTANYLNDLLRAHTGRSVGRWITDMRMARARVTLERTDRPISEISFACGYEDPAYFARAFRRAHGVSPRTWRIAARPIDQRRARITLPVKALHSSETVFEKILGDQLPAPNKRSRVHSFG